MKLTPFVVLCSLKADTMKQIIFAVCVGLALCALVLHGLDALFM